ncbi:MAG: hypothetical protein C6Y20_21695, partial [Tagaea sp. CACIAM 22H2]|nr:hypothetical protein [Tagaea sp. CACIAM 22H2]
PQGAGDAGQSEDCLVLNVWAPEHRAAAKRPVLVYIHGGGYTSGAGDSPLTHGARLAARGDVVVITLNHRLNLFGHLHLASIAGADYAASGNAGLLDLVLALEWVRDNAAVFGGDPGNVTLFGQSGGGAKIACLMAMPSAKGLFHRVWTMSGQQVTVQGPRAATARARAAMEQADLSLDQLLAAPADKLLAALNARDPTIATPASTGAPSSTRRRSPRIPSGRKRPRSRRTFRWSWATRARKPAPSSRAAIRRSST